VKDVTPLRVKDVTPLRVKDVTPLRVKDVTPLKVKKDVMPSPKGVGHLRKIPNALRAGDDGLQTSMPR
jgi:hypothetical protein